MLNFINGYSELGEEFGAFVNPEGFERPKMVAVNKELLKEIGIDAGSVSDDDLAEFLAGNKIAPTSKPFASVYSGHQFGGYSPRLGDGRALLLGEVVTGNDSVVDLQLKGAGLTPYSRMGDGRAVLRSVIREYLGSEAMFHLGIPTTRALSIVGSDHAVYRETTETGAIMGRVSKSHTRFGHFEYFHHNGRHDELQTLLDYTIERNFPEIKDEESKYDLFFYTVVKRTADLIAKWQCVGYTHGVMNTDNMSIVGDTIDYGPYGFMDNYESMYIPNHSDSFGRYAYAKQPQIGMWNLQCLGTALSSVITEESIQSILGEYPTFFNGSYIEGMAAKFGLLNITDEIVDFIFSTLKTLERNRADFTNFFRALSRFDGNGDCLAGFLKDEKARCEWVELYDGFLKLEDLATEERHEKMKSVNPKYILRNYMLQNAIEKAETGDFSEVERLHELFRKPFDEELEFEEYAVDSPDWGKKLVISCSS